MNAVALVTESVIKSPLAGFLEAECRNAGIVVEFYNVTASCARYSELFRATPNVITWNCRMPHSWMTKWGNNVLFVENSLLCQRAGVFIDHGGFFANSNLCHKQTWRKRYNVNLDAFTRKHFGWGVMEGGTPDGPVLVVLQNPIDSSVVQGFPAAGHNKDKIGAALSIIIEHLPRNRRVIVRPNPRFLEAWTHDAMLPEGWTVEHSEPFHQVLPRCSAMITVNSTAAREAVTLGIPTAVLSTGAFTGSGAVFECHDAPERLRGFFDWTPDLDSCRYYAEAILGRHFMSYTTPRPGNPELASWLQSAINAAR